MTTPLLRDEKTGLYSLPNDTLSKDIDGQYLKDWHHCIRCNKWIQAVRSLGCQSCRIHPLPLNTSKGRFWGEGQYECCGVSASPFDKHGRRVETYSYEFQKGCSFQDHCSLQSTFSSDDRLYENQWPPVLREAIDADVKRIEHSAALEWRDIKRTLTYKGLRIDDSNSFYLERYDEDNFAERRRHKYYKNKRLSKCIKVYDSKQRFRRELILANDETVADIYRLFLSGFYNVNLFQLQLGTTVYGPSTKIGSLSEDETYTIFVPAPFKGTAQN